MQQLYQRNLPKNADRENKIKNNIKEIATEALGIHNAILNKRKNNKTPWFRKEMKETCKENCKTYLKYKVNNTTKFIPIKSYEIKQ